MQDLNPAILSSKIPTTCPFPDCNDPIPRKPSEALVHLFQQLMRQNGGPGSQLTNLEICVKIAKENKKDDPIFLRRAEKKNWPTVIDFALLPNRILQLQKRLHGLVTDYNVL